ncbi:MAG: bifunctional aspartate kinase/homoserine dehydrogenase I [Gammaproteobacteria bacterium]|nr:MAG: bifunctional aspartate kinase/homoserine dehydrogenase I [Gammaproteobacteria bacterium]
MLIQKFGGSSLASMQGFLAAADIIGDAASDEKVVVVLSAVNGITDLLEKAIVAAVQGDDFRAVLNRIEDKQREILHELQAAGLNCPAASAFLAEQQKRSGSLLEGAALLEQCPPQARAEVLSGGEGFSSRLMSELLQVQGHTVCWSDTDVLPPANDSYSDSLVDIEAAAPLLQGALSGEHGILVLPGFYCLNAEGRPQLMGRNGSDYTAAAVAAALAARSLQIWKDVDGFFTADPRIVASAKCLDEASYEEAMELSFFGARVISAKALTPLMSAGIPCEIRNTYHPDHVGTLIHANTRRPTVVRGISHLDDVASITLQGGGMRGRIGVARRVMEALASQSISVLLIVQSSSEYSITLCVRSSDAKRAQEALAEAFHFELLHGLISAVSVLDQRSVITLVGDGMNHYRGIAARFLSAVSTAGVNVEVIAQGSTECAIAVVVEKQEAKPALRACHTAFFSHTSHMDVILLGCGNVGSVLLQQFQKQDSTLIAGHKALHVRAIANSRKLLVGHDTVELANWKQDLEKQGSAWTIDDILGIRKQLGLLNPTIIDCTSDAGLAAEYVTFLANGFNVVAANKKANTTSMAYYREIRAVAARHFRKFMYETNVGAGLPVIDTLQSLIRSGDELKSFGGILSGSLSMIFGMLEDDIAFSAAVEKAMQLGFTEPDPRDDLSGMDVARKLLIIAREVGLELELDDIEVEPVIASGFGADAGNDELIAQMKELDEGFAARVEDAKAEGGVLRYIGRIEGGHCSVSVDVVPKNTPLGSIRDGENALVLHTRYYQPIPLVLRGYGAGADVTAAGVFGDLLRTAWRPLDL